VNLTMMKTNSFVFLCLAAVLSLGGLAVAQQPIDVYVGDINGPDAFLNERVRLLFMEEFSKIKALELVDSKDKAQLTLDGIARFDAGQEEAVLSVKLLDLGSGRIVFAGNKNEKGSASGAAKDAVLYMVQDMKKALKWK
jgi:hypothetical protein